MTSLISTATKIKPVRTLYVIGIGAGSPDYLSQQAISALSRSEVVISLDKGDAKADLLALRQQIVDTHAPEVPIVAVTDPPRDRNPQDYRAEVLRWHQARATLLAQTIRANSSEQGQVAFLVWGDPSLYDSTLRIIEHMRNLEDLDCEVKVVPGITAVQVLTAEHAILINRIGEAIHITTGRNFADTPAQQRRNCVVMLDGKAAWLDAYTEHTYIYWGAFLGTPQQVLRKGYVAEIGEELAQLKARLRAEHGWIMDTYLIREFDEESPADQVGEGIH
ncbi:Precorrin-6A synthase (deacetylating) [Corynebacterium kutscheri]|uniref:Precorrin-6A synthase (Deacetylating) n=1 Tax=Corynebacterium kutscheri TaxID=35755 RepID=A0AB38VP73_9CORY|nr:Precorrin-6A synthase (deacetylating) [Corynebacterium kutscheri]VEH80278.1 Precorrin-6A synthase (deacetylating) [Corynebacterium kutscheri]